MSSIPDAMHQQQVNEKNISNYNEEVETGSGSGVKIEPADRPVRDAEWKALVWKQDKRIIPLCAGIYLLCYLDRSW